MANVLVDGIPVSPGSQQLYAVSLDVLRERLSGEEFEWAEAYLQAFTKLRGYGPFNLLSGGNGDSRVFVSTADGRKSQISVTYLTLTPSMQKPM